MYSRSTTDSTGMSTTNMEPSNEGVTEKIRVMISTQSYNVTMIRPLEEYILLMCQDTVPYMFDAVRILIKLYSIFPDTTNDSSTRNKNEILDYMGLCCLLALTYGSNTNDIIALRYMIPTSFIPKDNVNLVSQVYHCATLYDNSLFTDFWASYTTSFTQESTKSGLPVTELETTIKQVAVAAIPTLQTSIATILSITYQQAPIDIVYKALNVTDLVEVTKNNPTLIESFDSNLVNFVPTTHNTQRLRTYQESINYTTVSNLRFPSIAAKVVTTEQ